MQGQSSHKAVIDVGQSVLALGQAYVAFSRVKFSGKVILVELIRSAFCNNDHVHQDYERFAGLPIMWLTETFGSSPTLQCSLSTIMLYINSNAIAHVTRFIEPLII